MSAQVGIYIGGFLTLVIALYHTQLYKKLNWVEEFEKIDSENAKIIYTINLSLMILFFLIGGRSVLFLLIDYNLPGLQYSYKLKKLIR